MAEADPRDAILGVDLPIREVTLLEDRAVVRREGSITLPAGITRVRVDRVSPVLVDKTLTAEVVGGESGLRVRDVAIERRRVTSDADRPSDVAQLRAQVRDAEAGVRAAEHEGQQAHDDLAAMLQLHGRTVTELGEDSGWGTFDAGRAGSALDDITARVDALVTRRVRATAEIAERKRELADLRRLLDAGRKLDSRAIASARVDLDAPGAGGTATLRLEYVVPGAQWRPWHTARLHEPDDGPARVVLRCEGCVWQATGEDWDDVQLSFSTERPSLGVRPPELRTDTLHIRKRGSTVQAEARDQKIHTAGLGGAPAAAEAEELPGIDDGGEALSLRGRGKATIPGDGRPHRVTLFEVESEAEVALVCMPELAASVMLRSRQVNRGRYPILAGPVDLVRHSGLVGRTSTLFVAPDERFELGWGPDPALRVHREVEHLEHQRRTMSSWTRKPRRVDIKLSNLGAAPRRVEVTERIAVSEIEKVEVELVEASGGATPDDDGLVTWPVDLKGYGRHELTLTWTLVVHDDVTGL